MKKLEKLTLKEMSNQLDVIAYIDYENVKGGYDPTESMDFAQYDLLDKQGQWFGGLVEGQWYGPTCGVNADGPNTDLMSFNSFIESCKSDYSSVVTGGVGDVVSTIFPPVKLLFDASSVFDEVNSIAGSDANYDAIKAIVAQGYANGDIVTLSVTRTANNISIYDTNGNLIYTTR